MISPYATLDPGEQYEFTVHWAPTRLPNPVVKAVWAGAISRPLSGEVSGNQVTLKGVFGVFVPGSAEAAFYSAMGEDLGHQKLQDVDPREVFRLDKTLTVPANAFRVSVFVADRDGQNHGFLGNVILKKGFRSVSDQP
ncbi:MAG TPA: hypothetical protein VFC10_07015 [Terriglobia bacterium]|nr:hypothetical protein [Terriglobia bacterium]